MASVFVELRDAMANAGVEGAPQIDLFDEMA